MIQILQSNGIWGKFLIFLKNHVLKNEQHPLFPKVDNDHKGRGKSKSEIIYLQNNQIFDVVNILNLYFIFMNLELIVLIRLIFLILFQHWKE
jgi:hypothetical protein